MLVSAEDEDRKGVYFANPPISLCCLHPYSGCRTVGESVTSVVLESAEILGDCTNRHDGEGSEVSRSGTAEYTDCSIINWANERQNALAANDKSKLKLFVFFGSAPLPSSSQ